MKQKSKTEHSAFLKREKMLIVCSTSQYGIIFSTSHVKMLCLTALIIPIIISTETIKLS
jgi:hypothetical protein